MYLLKTACHLLLTVSLLGVASCSKEENRIAAVDITIHILNCDAPLTRVPAGKTVGWVVDDPAPKPTYIVNFTAAKPPSTSPFLVGSTAAPKPHQMNQYPPCDKDHPDQCDYKYTLTKNADSEPCKDPVIRIVPIGLTVP
jgi:hypothetical protein